MNLTGKLLTAATVLAAFTGAASAADLYVPPPAAPMAMAPAVSSWDGLYIGALVGYSQGTANDTASSTSGQVDTSGWQLGIQGGYNFHLTDVVVAGISADLVWDNASGSVSTPFDVTEQRNWDGSVTGRLGVDLNGVVPYVLGGVAFANDTRTDNLAAESISTTHTGYTVGAGVEFALAQNLSADVEYRYTNYGAQDYAFASGTQNVNLTDNSIRLGLNYHFQ